MWFSVPVPKIKFEPPPEGKNALVLMQTAFSSFPLFGCLLVFLFLRVRSVRWFGEWL